MWRLSKLAPLRPYAMARLQFVQPRQAASTLPAGGIVLQGTVQRIVFHAEETGYTIARLQVTQAPAAAGGEQELPQVGDVVTLQSKGGLVAVESGTNVEVEGEWTTHTRYGDQVKVSRVTSQAPRSGPAVAQYLASGAFKGVGPVIAQRIVDTMGGGTATMQILKEQRFNELTRVKGVSKRLANSIATAWKRNQGLQDLTMFLQEHDIPVSLTARLTTAFGAGAAQDVLQANPYRLMEIPGIGFATADAVAARMGQNPTSDARVAAAALHALQDAAADGHCCVPEAELVEDTLDMLQAKTPAPAPAAAASAAADTQPPTEDDSARQPFTRERVLQQLALLSATGQAAVRGDAAVGERMCFSQSLDAAEKATAACVAQLLAGPDFAVAPASGTPWQAAVDAALTRLSGGRAGAGATGLNEQQRQALETAMTSTLSIVTGGPGTGKTHVTRAIVEAWRALGLRVALACPTARAAHRLNEVLGPGRGGAVTIHRLLGYGSPSHAAPVSLAADGTAPPTAAGRRFRRSSSNPLDVDALLVDEASMLDIHLASSLFGALGLGDMGEGSSDSDGSEVASTARPLRVVLVGDVNQLPSVGPGRVLADLLAARGLVPSTVLHEVFRQAATSAIVRNAHTINQGQVPRQFGKLTPAENQGPVLRAQPQVQQAPPPVMAASGQARAGAPFRDVAAAVGLGLPTTMRAPRRPPNNAQLASESVAQQATSPSMTATSDCVWVEASAPEDALDELCGPVLKAVRDAGYDPLTQMQVIAPMRRGPVGTDAVNRRLQAILNPLPPSAAAPRGGARGLLRPGDRVMQQQNNYDREVVNGDWGTVVSVDDSGGAVVSFVTESPVAPRESPTSTPQVAPAHGNTPWRLVEYSAAEARKQLALSYAVSVHKAQGNEWPVVVLMLHMSHYIMLTRGLIYTALCRAQELSIVVGSNKALAIGVREVRDQLRYTCLTQRIQEECASRSGHDGASPALHAAPVGAGVAPSMTSDDAWHSLVVAEPAVVMTVPGSSAAAAEPSAASSTAAAETAASSTHANWWSSMDVATPPPTPLPHIPPRRMPQQDLDVVRSLWTAYGLESALEGILLASTTTTTTRSQ